MSDDLLTPMRNGISIKARKQILKASLKGIAELHSHDIVHLGKWSRGGFKVGSLHLPSGPILSGFMSEPILG
jgi:hypothetical protein